MSGDDAATSPLENAAPCEVEVKIVTPQARALEFSLFSAILLRVNLNDV
jgi:hypothetical protein